MPMFDIAVYKDITYRCIVQVEADDDEKACELAENAANDIDLSEWSDHHEEFFTHENFDVEEITSDSPRSRRTYRNQFPNNTWEDLDLNWLAQFNDNSWKNDVAPSWEITKDGKIYKLFIDSPHVNPYPDDPDFIFDPNDCDEYYEMHQRCILCETTPYGDNIEEYEVSDEVFSTDDFVEMKSLIADWFPETYLLNTHGHYFSVHCSIDKNKLKNCQFFDTVDSFYIGVAKELGLSFDVIMGSEFSISLGRNCYDDRGCTNGEVINDVEQFLSDFEL